MDFFVRSFNILQWARIYIDTHTLSQWQNPIKMPKQTDWYEVVFRIKIGFFFSPQIRYILAIAHWNIDGFGLLLITCDWIIGFLRIISLLKEQYANLYPWHILFRRPKKKKICSKIESRIRVYRPKYKSCEMIWMPYGQKSSLLFYSWLKYNMLICVYLAVFGANFIFEHKYFPLDGREDCCSSKFSTLNNNRKTILASI